MSAHADTRYTDGVFTIELTVTEKKTHIVRTTKLPVRAHVCRASCTLSYNGLRVLLISEKPTSSFWCHSAMRPCYASTTPLAGTGISVDKNQKIPAPLGTAPRAGGWPTSRASRGVHHWHARAPSLLMYARSALQTQAVNCSYRTAGMRSGCTKNEAASKNNSPEIS